MELTQKTFMERLERLQFVVREKPEELEQLRDSLHEKGVECAIIVPLLETVLDFNAVTDVSYEQSSPKHHRQRFDFLVDGHLLIEAKELGANLDDHYKQVSEYIFKNNAIDFGILTNGIEYQVWVQREFIERVTGTKLPHTDRVTKVFELSLLTDPVQFLLDAFSLFAKSSYESSFKTIAAVTGYYASGSRGRPPVLHTDKAVDEELRSRIREASVIQKGVYFDDVESGKLSAGDKLRFRNECVEITVEVTATGTVILKKDGANVIDMMVAIRKGWSPIIPLIAEKWSKADTEFQDTLQIIKLGLNKQKLYGQDKYAFERISAFSQ